MTDGAAAQHGVLHDPSRRDDRVNRLAAAIAEGLDRYCTAQHGPGCGLGRHQHDALIAASIAMSGAAAARRQFAPGPGTVRHLADTDT